ncbi:MAG: HAMP domain-containing sensor histidine kinase [Planctomycetota bacterium]
MSSSRAGVRYAIVGFVLIAFVVVGGMSWATIATWELAKFDLREEHLAKLREAVGRMDNHVLGILKTEAAREYTDYRDLHIPQVIYSVDGEQLDPRQYLQPSRIAANKPRHEWIEVYVQVDEEGNWTSPHIARTDAYFTIELDVWEQKLTNRARSTLNWLRESVSVQELRERFAKAIERFQMIGGGVIEGSDNQVAPEAERKELVSDRQKDMPKASTWVRAGRVRNPLRAQRPYIPTPPCIPTDIAEWNIRQAAYSEPRIPYDAELRSSEVAIEPTELVPFWLGTARADNEQLRMAFFRTFPKVPEVHQGFIGNWPGLKSELLQKVNEIFPNAELEPIFESPERADGSEVSPGENEMEQLPVRLKVPDPKVAATTDAWRKVRGVLLTSWIAAVAVLAVAGWGVRGLVSLTQRRLQFAYAVTHELRTPLTTFRLYTDMLSAGLVPESSKGEYLDTLNRESQRLATLVEDVLEYARLENHKVRLNPVNIKGKELLRLLTESLEARCKAYGIQALTHNDVPEEQSLRTDVDLVGQITGVLVNNACRHAKAAEKPEVLVQVASDNGKLHVNVVDTGPGVDRSDVRQIFKPFRRGRNADATAQGGIGLGLALARNWAMLLGGRLDLVSRHHATMGGAHFRLTVPSRSDS